MKKTLLLLTATLGLAGTSAHATAIAITALNDTYVQDFNTLISTDGDSATYVDETTIAGWIVNSDSMDNNSDIYVAEDGSSTSGQVYSFGADGNSDRALGYLGSGSNDYFNAVIRLVNDTGSTVNQISLSFVGEQWRSGGNTSDNNNAIVFSHRKFVAGAGSVPASTNLTGWSAVNSFDFSAPQTNLAAGSLNGNLAANRTSISGAISGLNWTNGEELWLRWTGDDGSGTDAGLGIDDVNITAIPEPSTFALVVLTGMAALGILGRRKK